ncbi:MAG: hypothetical protein R3F14_13835 [Polyangiaceae bacterium]
MTDPPFGGTRPRDENGGSFSWNASPGGPPRAPDAPPIHDPFLHPPAPPPRKQTPWLAVVAIVSTALFLAAAAAAFWLWRARPSPSVTAPPPVGVPTVLPPPVPSDIASAPPTVLPAPDPSAPATAAPSALPPGVPADTVEARRGSVLVVDLGVRTTRTLQEELAQQRAAAQSAGETLLVMTTQYGSPLLRDFDAALPDPQMQSALARVRLVRVDSRHFQVELDALGVPTESYPWFLLLGTDLVPRDGISGGEWDADIPRNIAPVLGPFVKGTLSVRRERWKPPRSKGVEL